MDLFDIAVAKKLAGGGGGSEPVIESLSVTENGTYTATSGVDGYSPITVNVPSGGGASNIVTGSFTTPEITSGKTKIENIDIGYTGNKYPIALMIQVKSARPELDSAQSANSIVASSMYKDYTSTAPTYEGSGNGDHVFLTSLAQSGYGINGFNNSVYGYDASGATAATNNPSKSIIFKDATTLSYAVAKKGWSYYALLPETEYEYVIWYAV